MASLLPFNHKNKSKNSISPLLEKEKTSEIIEIGVIAYEFTLVVGIVGRMRVHLGRVLPLAGQVEQSRPSSQLLLVQVSPTCNKSKFQNK